jgi:hypothetical protein
LAIGELQESAALEQSEPERPQMLLQGWKKMNMGDPALK